MNVTPLDPLPKYHAFPGPVVLAVLDGVGIGKRDESDGVYMAYTPILDDLFQEPLFTTLKAHGTAVGMPSDSDMGNSEVGHNALGAGRVFAQGAKLVGDAFKNESVFESEAWRQAVERARNGGTLHLVGLTSDGNVHSHIDHLYGLLDRAVEENIERVRIHTLLDGRDVGEKSALTYLEPLETRLKELQSNGRDYRIASGGGRMVTTMDRYNADWSIVERGWKAHVLGEGRAFASASEAVRTYYDEDPDIVDQYLDSFVVVEDGNPAGTIEDGDAVIVFNFRGDRAIELSQAFENDDFRHFDRVRRPDVFFAGMTQYDGDLKIPKHFLVSHPVIEGSMSKFLCASGITSYAISETQKFGHVTYFWNGNNSGYVDESLEEYVEIPSDRVPFDERPWMKAAEITDAVIQTIREGKRKFIRINYANGDMVGHTGIPAAIRISVEAVDLSLRRLLPAIRRAKGVAVILSDHGNADLMFTEKNGVREPMVAHTLNPVPFIVKDYSGANAFELADVDGPGLSNVAATVFTLLGLTPPAEYDASLVRLA